MTATSVTCLRFAVWSARMPPITEAETEASEDSARRIA